MRHLVRLLLLLMGLAGPGCAMAEKASGKNEDWFTVERDVWMPPVSLTHYLDPPAGEHGFLGVRENRFEFENGSPIRFWGVTVSGEGCFPAASQAPVIAERLASLGVNLVRFKRLDSTEIEPPLVQLQPNGDVRFNPVAVDRLDYFIFQLANRGIYAYLHGLSAFRFPAPPQAEPRIEPPTGLGGYIFFVPPYRHYFQRFLQRFWLHENPYFRRQYRDIPAVALFQLFDRHHLSNLQPVIPAHLSLLRTQFSDWQEGLDLPPQPFVPNAGASLQRRYALEQMTAMVNDGLQGLRSLSVKSAIAGSSAFESSGDIARAAGMDFVTFGEIHRPAITVEEATATSTVDQSLANQHNRFSRLAFARVVNKPYLINQWGDLFPQPFRAETPLWLAALACGQGWNGLIAGDWRTQSGGPGLMHREMAADPVSYALMPIAAMLFHRNEFDDFSPRYQMAWSTSLVERETPLAPSGLVTTRLVDRAQVAWRLPATAASGRVVAPTEPAKLSQIHEQLGPPRGIVHDTGRGLVLIDTPTIQAAIGDVGATQRNDLPHLAIQSKEPFAVIALASLDEEPVEDAQSLLLTAVSRARPSGSREELTTAAERFAWLRSQTIEIKKVPAWVFFETEHAHWRIEAIDMQGQVIEILPYQVEENQIAFKIGLAPALHYRLQRLDR